MTKSYLKALMLILLRACIILGIFFVLYGNWMQSFELNSKAQREVCPIQFTKLVRNAIDSKSIRGPARSPISGGSSCRKGDHPFYLLSIDHCGDVEVMFCP
jgi:hypothetical protein